MANSITVTIEFDRPVNPAYTTQVFADQLTEVLTGKSRGAAIGESWGMGAARVTGVVPA